MVIGRGVGVLLWCGVVQCKRVVQCSGIICGLRYDFMLCFVQWY